jgi:hypothetical protein
MGNWIWGWIFRRSRWDVKKPLRDDVVEALRESRPVPPDLPVGRAESILAHAIADAMMPGRRGSRSVTLVAVLGVAGCALAVGLGLAPQMGDRRMETASSAPGLQRWKRPIVEAEAVQLEPDNRSHTRRSVTVPRSGRLAAKRIRHRRLFAHRIWALRPVRQHPAATVLHDEQTLAASPIERRGVSLGVVPSAVQGHLVLIVTGSADPRPIVEIAAGGDTTTGFAKASAYQAVGTGGGILTQCTIRDDAQTAAVNTTQYGIVYGQPALRLPVEVERPTGERTQNERGVTP